LNRKKTTLDNENYALLQLYKDPLLIFFASLLPILWYFKRDALAILPTYIHWPTIVALSGLLMITNCFKYSGLFSKLASRMLKQVKTERALWIGLILFSALIATFLTNDIALFLVIPFTIQLNRMADLNIMPLFIFETIAVNLGSLITPIGNPQNIYVWQKFNIGFGRFILHMLPVGAILLGILVLGCFLFAPTHLITLNGRQDYEIPKTNLILAGGGAIGLVGYLLADGLGYGLPFVCLFFVILLFGRPKILLSMDWGLIILFILLFIDMGMFSGLSPIREVTQQLALHDSSHVFLTGALYAQLLSNVPTTLLLSKFTHAWYPLAAGVNIGGNGLLIGSFANLIAVRITKKPKLALMYHRYSIPFFVVSVIVVYLLLM